MFRGTRCDALHCSRTILPAISWPPVRRRAPREPVFVVVFVFDFFSVSSRERYCVTGALALGIGGTVRSWSTRVPTHTPAAVHRLVPRFVNRFRPTFPPQSVPDRFVTRFVFFFPALELSRAISASPLASSFGIEIEQAHALPRGRFWGGWGRGGGGTTSSSFERLTANPVGSTLSDTPFDRICDV